MATRRPLAVSATTGVAEIRAAEANLVASYIARGRRTRPEGRLVVMDRNGANYCGRLWWMLKWVGHADVAVLDGGLQAAEVAQLLSDGARDYFAEPFNIPLIAERLEHLAIDVFDVVQPHHRDRVAVRRAERGR